MDDLFEILYRYGAEDLIDSRRAILLNNDVVYLNDVKDLYDLEQRYEELNMIQISPIMKLKN